MRERLLSSLGRRFSATMFWIKNAFERYLYLYLVNILHIKLFVLNNFNSLYYSGFTKLHMCLEVLVKKCQSSLIFYCKIPVLSQSLAKYAQILLVTWQDWRISRTLIIALLKHLSLIFMYFHHYYDCFVTKQF
jgi:hypothetical protein